MFDVLTIASLTDELSNQIVDGRIQKVIQLDDTSYGLEIYAQHRRIMLVARASSQNPALYLSSARVTADPNRVSPLLLLLRKYARGGFVVAVEQPPLERIVRLSIAKRLDMDKKPDRNADDEEENGSDELSEGDLVYTHMIVELMGRHSNVVLTDDDGKIMDSAKRVTMEMSRVRPILPHRKYTVPPPQDKHHPESITPELMQEILNQDEEKTQLVPHLVRNVAAVSPQVAREVIFRASDETNMTLSIARTKHDLSERLADAFQELAKTINAGTWAPAVYFEDGVPVAFAPVPLTYLEEQCDIELYDTISGAAERHIQLSGQVQPVRHAQRRDTLAETIGNARDRLDARVRSLSEQSDRAADADQYREFGELIYSWLWKISPGDTELDADGVIVPLDSERTASENAQRYFERYKRFQGAIEELESRLKAARNEFAYLDQLYTLTSQAEGIDQIEQLRREWEQYQRKDQLQADEQRKRKRKRKGSGQPEAKRPEQYRTSRGDQLYVGRNGTQNERVTFDIAGPDDLWLHARGLPGSHVALRLAGDPDDGILERAAAVAAWFSGARDATSAEVDVAERKHVRKIRGSGPGMVTYRNELTLNVRPSSPEDAGFTSAS